MSGGRGDKQEETASKRTWMAIPSRVVVGGADARCGPEPKQAQKETHDAGETSSGSDEGMKAVVSRDMKKEGAMSWTRAYARATSSGRKPNSWVG